MDNKDIRVNRKEKARLERRRDKLKMQSWNIKVRLRKVDEELGEKYDADREAYKAFQEFLYYASRFDDARIMAVTKLLLEKGAFTLKEHHDILTEAEVFCTPGKAPAKVWKRFAIKADDYDRMVK